MFPARLPKKPKRDSRWRSQAHCTHVRGHACSIPGCKGMPIEVAHVRLGSGTGAGQKPHDFLTVALCSDHHRQQHTIGEATFWQNYQRASGKTVDELIDFFCRTSPRAMQIREARNG